MAKLKRKYSDDERAGTLAALDANRGNALGWVFSDGSCWGIDRDLLPFLDPLEAEENDTSL